MTVSMNRRTFIATSMAVGLSGRAAFAQPLQTFRAGLVASAPRPAGALPFPATGPRPVVSDEDQVKSFLRGMDDASRLGVHYVEKTNGPDPLLTIYKGREGAFKDELDKRNLKLAGLANNCHAGRAELKQAMVEQNLRTARFVKAMGGTYIALVLDPTEGNDQSGDVSEFRKLDPKIIAANVDEMARTAYEETGITVGYHPEDGDSAAGLVEYLMENTKHLYYFPDIGWMQMAGMDAVASCKKYYSRINGMHLRDFQPQPPGSTVRGIVPLGQGIIDLKGLMNFLREQKFTGYVIGEGQTNQSNYDYMHGVLGLQF